MNYTCPRCGFWYIDNMGGTLEEAVIAWRLSIKIDRSPGSA